MNKTIKLLSLFLLSTLFTTLVACGLSENDVVGTWRSSYIYNNKTFDVSLKFDLNGKYEYLCITNGKNTDTETGDYEIKGNSVIIYHRLRNTSTKYEYIKGQLVNGSQYLSKK